MRVGRVALSTPLSPLPPSFPPSSPLFHFRSYRRTRSPWTRGLIYPPSPLFPPLSPLFNVRSFRRTRSPWCACGTRGPAACSSASPPRCFFFFFFTVRVSFPLQPSWARVGQPLTVSPPFRPPPPSPQGTGDESADEARTGAESRGAEADEVFADLKVCLNEGRGPFFREVSKGLRGRSLRPRPSRWGPQNPIHSM